MCVCNAIATPLIAFLAIGITDDFQIHSLQCEPNRFRRNHIVWWQIRRTDEITERTGITHREWIWSDTALDRFASVRVICWKNL